RDLKATKYRLKAFLLRQDIRYEGRANRYLSRATDSRSATPFAPAGPQRRGNRRVAPGQGS
ncbi:MAG: hypothetical protein ACRDGM_09800, partial [bacterium]